MIIAKHEGGLQGQPQKDTFHPQNLCLYDYGTAYLRVDVQKNLNGKQIRITLDSSDSARWSLVSSRLTKVKGSDDQILVNSPRTDWVSSAIELKTADHVMIGLLNMGSPDYDADFAAVPATVVYKLELENAGTSG